MKKWTGVLLILLLIFVFSGCGQKSAYENAADTEATAKAESADNSDGAMESEPAEETDDSDKAMEAFKTMYRSSGLYAYDLNVFFANVMPGGGDEMIISQKEDAYDNFDVSVYHYDTSSVSRVWTESITNSIAGMDGYFLVNYEGKDAIMRYNPNMNCGICDMTLQIFRFDENGIPDYLYDRNAEYVMDEADPSYSGIPAEATEMETLSLKLAEGGKILADSYAITGEVYTVSPPEAFFGED